MYACIVLHNPVVVLLNAYLLVHVFIDLHITSNPHECHRHTQYYARPHAQDDDSMGLVLAHIDNAVQYGEDLEFKETGNSKEYD